jgi:transposase
MAAQTLKEGLHAAKAAFVSRLVAVLVERTDLSQKRIGQDFGVSESFVRKIARRFAVPHRKRGPKPQPIRRSIKERRSGDD